MAYEDIKCKEGYFWCRAHLEERPLSERSTEDGKYCVQCYASIKADLTERGMVLKVKPHVAEKTVDQVISEGAKRTETGWVPTGRKLITKEITVNGKTRLQRFWVKE